jgi:DNA-binding LytR/AlgR family response regulator
MRSEQEGSMALIEAAPSDDMRVILCLKFDRRAPFDAVATFKQNLLDRACVVHSIESSGAFDFMIEAGLPDFASYHALLDDFAVELATLIERQEASFVCRRYLRTIDRDQSVWVPCRDGRRRVDCGTIDLVRAEGDYVRLHCGTQNWLLHDTMHHMRELLDPDTFLTLHRSTIANVDFIKRLVHRRHYWVAILDDDSEQRIAKSHVVAILAALRTESSNGDADPPTRRHLGESSAPPMEQEVRPSGIRAI